MNEFIVFLVVLALGVFFSEVFKRFHLPYVVAFTALELGLLDPSLQVSIVFLSMVTVLLAPFIVGSLATHATDRSPMDA